MKSNRAIEWLRATIEQMKDGDPNDFGFCGAEERDEYMLGPMEQIAKRIEILHAERSMCRAFLGGYLNGLCQEAGAAPNDETFARIEALARTVAQSAEAGPLEVVIMTRVASTIASARKLIAEGADRDTIAAWSTSEDEEEPNGQVARH